MKIDVPDIILAIVIGVLSFVFFWVISIHYLK
jgi:hypothetical protein